MKKWGKIVVGAIVIAASTLVLAQGGEEVESDQSEMLCHDAVCNEVFWEEPPVFEEDFAIGLTSEQAAEGGGMLDYSGEDDGDCEYHGDHGYIECTVDRQYTSVAVGYATWTTDEDEHVIIMCYNDSGNITLGGWSIIGDADELYVDGSSSGDYVGILKWETKYTNDCDFKDFPGIFNDDLEIDGLGGTDTIGGSQHDDRDLVGEQVDGYAGDDTIHISNGWPRIAWGARGKDTIYGSSGDDSIWGDDVGDTVGGNDYIRGYQGDDQLAGVYGNDSVYGDWGNDTLWGGDGDDSLNCGVNPPSGGDTVYCGDGTDTTVACENTSGDCES